MMVTWINIVEKSIQLHFLGNFGPFNLKYKYFKHCSTFVHQVFNEFLGNLGPIIRNSRIISIKHYLSNTICSWHTIISKFTLLLLSHAKTHSHTNILTK